MGKKVLPNFQPSAECTGELFGVEYLYAQSGVTFIPSEEDLLTDIDEGFGDIDEEITDTEISSNDVTVALPSASDSESEDEVSLFVHTMHTIHHLDSRSQGQMRSLRDRLTPGELKDGRELTSWHVLFLSSAGCLFQTLKHLRSRSCIKTCWSLTRDHLSSHLQFARLHEVDLRGARDNPSLEWIT